MVSCTFCNCITPTKTFLCSYPHQTRKRVNPTINNVVLSHLPRHEPKHPNLPVTPVSFVTVFPISFTQTPFLVSQRVSTKPSPYSITIADHGDRRTLPLLLRSSICKSRKTHSHVPLSSSSVLGILPQRSRRRRFRARRNIPSPLRAYRYKTCTISTCPTQSLFPTSGR
jgi:hypothetical protein